MFPFLTGVSSGGGGGGGSDGSLAAAAPFAATSKNGSRCQLDLNFNVFLTVLKTSVVNPDLKFSRIQIRNYLFRIRKKCKSRKKTDTYFLYLLLLFRKVLWIVLLHVITVTVD